MPYDKPQDCRLCHKKLKSLEIVGDYVFGGRPEQKFYRCQDCDVAFLYPAMTEEEEHKFYAKEFEKYMEKRAGQDMDWSGPAKHFETSHKQYVRRLRFFEDLIAPGKRVLEVGCSSGFMLVPLKEKGMEVVGVEPSGGFGSFLIDKGVTVYDSIETLKKNEEEKKFDLIMHFFVLEHVRNPVEFLKQLMELLTPHGTMIVEIPNKSDPLVTIYKIPAFDKFYWSVAHNWYFSQPSLEFVLKQVARKFEILPEQRYDISNHMTWVLEGKPGGQGKYSSMFTPELDQAYLDSMKKTGHCDTLIARISNSK